MKSLSKKFNINLFIILKDLKKYNLNYFRKDIFAALSVALLAIPQAIAYSLLAGLPPMAGVYAAIFGTIFTGAFASSRYLVSGMSIGISILIQTSIADILANYYPNVVGLEKEQIVITILMQLVLFMGVFQIIFSLFNFGKLLQFVSRSVILGYFVGVAIAILVNQLFPFLGILDNSENSLVCIKAAYLITHIFEMKFLIFGIGTLSLAIILFLKYFYKKIPYALISLVVISLIVYFLNNYGFNVGIMDNLSFKSSFILDFSMPTIDFKIFKKMIFAALAISLLSILEVFSISRGLSAKSGQNTLANQEIFAVGISNIFLTFLRGSMPASGSFSRSFLNFQLGAKTRFSSIFCGIIIVIIIYFGWGLIKFIPFCFLAALLISMMINLIKKDELKICFRASRGDAIAFSLTAFSCLIFSLDIAFFIGIVIAIFFYLQKAAKPYLEEYDFNKSGRLILVPKKGKKRKKVRIIGVAGGLFFGSCDLFQNTLRKMAKDPYVKVVILKLNRIYYVDATMCFALERLNEYYQASNRYLLISGISDEVYDVFSKCSIDEKIGLDHLFFTDVTNPQLSTWRAFQRAQKLIK